MADKVDFRPTLLVGVGGTGCAIAESVYEQAVQTRADKAGKIAVLGFDTDENDMRRRRGLDTRRKVQFSTSETIFRLLDRHPEVERDWFVDRSILPKSIENMTLLEGAAQIRMLTRLALHNSMKGNLIQQRIDDVLSTLGRHDSREPFEGAINVMMTGSLAGATGSGSFIQLALLIDSLWRSRSTNCTTSMRGIFLLPDVYVRAASIPQDQIPNILANGYASLKELFAVNTKASEEKEAERKYDFQYEYAPGHFLREGGIPFKSLTLIDFDNTKGGNLGRDIDHYKDMAARAVYQQIFTPIGGKFTSVTINDARAKFAAAADGADNLFSGVGISAVVYPADSIANYLTYRMAHENISGDWLRLDNMFFERIRRYNELRKSGTVDTKEPQQNQSYLEDLEQLAETERVPFFREVYSTLFPKKENERGIKKVRPVPHDYLDALNAQVMRSFWNTDTLTKVVARQNIDVAQLKNLTSLSEIVRGMERVLDEDLAEIEEALHGRPDDIFFGIMSLADDMAEAEWRDYHIQNYIIKEGPHLVWVRGFLYILLKEMRERRSALDVSEKKQRLYRLANIFDVDRGKNPDTRGTIKVSEEATDVAGRNFITKLTQGSPEDFQERYRDYYNSSQRFMRDYANEVVEEKTLDLLIDEAEQLVRTITGLFLEVKEVVKELESDIDREERRHLEGGIEFSGNVWVYADKESKNAIWKELKEQSAGLRLGGQASYNLTESVYKRHRMDRRERQSTAFDDLRDLFRTAVVEQFARSKIKEDFSSRYNFSVIEALKRECSLKGTSWKTRLREVVDVVGGQSEPFVTLTDRDAGQRIMFWAINPMISEEINDGEMFEALFALNQGEAPLPLPEFSEKELLCVNSRVNLELGHFEKLFPGDPDRTNINVSVEGRYYAAYKNMIDELIAAEMDTQGRKSREFTPHIHRDWHRPGVLPEIFSQLGDRQFDDIYRAFCLSLGLGLLQSITHYNREKVVFSTVGIVASGGVNKEVADTHDTYQTLLAFEKQPDLVRAALAYWSEARRSHLTSEKEIAGQYEDIAVVQVMTSPSFLLKLLQVSLVRDDENERDYRTRQLVKSWAYLVLDLVNSHKSDLASIGRHDLTSQLLDSAKTAAFTSLTSTGTSAENIRELEKIYETAISEHRSQYA